MRRFLFASAAALALVAASGDARANGRFPESNQIVFGKNEPDLVLVRVTFGILVSHDRGQTFDWVCETSIGYTGVEDPMYTVTPSGRYIGSTFQGLTMTSDKACNWALVGTPQPYIDLAANPNDAQNVIALSTVYKGQDDAGNVKFASSVAETKDEGSTWSDIGPPLDDTILGHTLDFTASDPDRLYVTAIRYNGSTPVGLLYTSKDRGKSWSEQVVPLTGTERAVYIAAVDPLDAEIVYLRTTNNPDKPGRVILRERNPSGDDGVFRTIFTGLAPLEGFALTPDGKKVYVGSPLDGVWVASTADFQFTQKSKVEVKCLALHGEELWACSNEKIGFIAGVSKDDGATFTSMLNFCKIRGPLSCPAGSTTETQCPALWAAQRDVLGCDGTTPNPEGGAFTDGGGFQPPSNGDNAGGGGSCDCQAVLPPSGWSTAGGTLACALGAAAALFRRRARDRKPSPRK
ncbi:MAG: hypothetical protein KIT84_44535 [Labilithrix sp.]|nr:hypothetical protein [Labilithrix sp.]MCW5818148.1 hypothetical protein [Labilithrix sp.]